MVRRKPAKSSNTMTFFWLPCMPLRSFSGSVKGLVLSLTIFSSLLFFPNSSQARTHEVSLAMGALTFGGGSTTWDFNANYEFDLLRWLFVGGKLKFNRSEAGSLRFSSWSLIATSSINFSSNVPEAVFVQAELGLKRSSSTGNTGTSSSETQGGFGLVMGKRFILSPPITFKPNIGFSKFGNSGISIVINALSFSVIL